jgi:hypothetical protein
MKQIIVLLMIFSALGAQAGLVQISADGNDQQWTTDGSSTWVGQTSGRVGSQTTDNLTGQVLPFLLPDLGGQSITDVSLDFTTTGGNIGNLDAPYNSYLDLIAPNAGTVASSVTSVNDLSGSVLVDAYLQLTVANFPANTTAGHTMSSGALTSYLQSIYDNDPSAAGKYVVLTLIPDTPIRGGRYFTMNTADSSSGLPTLNITTSVPEPATVGMLGLGAAVALLIRRFRG